MALGKAMLVILSFSVEKLSCSGCRSAYLLDDLNSLILLSFEEKHVSCFTGCVTKFTEIFLEAER